jgi:hypothetical protein
MAVASLSHDCVCVCVSVRIDVASLSHDSVCLCVCACLRVCVCVSLALQLPALAYPSRQSPPAQRPPGPRVPCRPHLPHGPHSLHGLHRPHGAVMMDSSRECVRSASGNKLWFSLGSVIRGGDALVRSVDVSLRSRVAAVWRIGEIFLARPIYNFSLSLQFQPGLAPV